MRNGLLIGGLVLALALTLGWAWRDGGERPLQELSAPAVLPASAP